MNFQRIWHDINNHAFGGRCIPFLHDYRHHTSDGRNAIRIAGPVLDVGSTEAADAIHATEVKESDHAIHPDQGVNPIPET